MYRDMQDNNVPYLFGQDLLKDKRCSLTVAAKEFKAYCYKGPGYPD